MKKKIGQTRCCIDFQDLSKVCLKDEFPLPKTDILVEATVGHSMVSFMDGLSSYDHIKMHPPDSKKNAFRTPIDNFHYIVMSFRVKNAGATYQ